jgi:hypothetical protein
VVPVCGEDDDAAPLRDVSLMFFFFFKNNGRKEFQTFKYFEIFPISKIG